MRLRNIPGAVEAVHESPYVIQEPKELKGKWREDFFHNDHPVHIEIGCGKGQFLTALAAEHPEINYIGIEKMTSVLLRAIQKRESYEGDNLFYLSCDAEEINEIFDEKEIDRIYLNFSDPWPKDRHKRRRLTSREFLARYEKVLKEGSVIEFKTDNVPLFDFSLEEQEAAGWELLLATRDLHRSEYNEGNIMTEYEERFSILGNKICKLVMKPGDNGSEPVKTENENQEEKENDIC